MEAEITAKEKKLGSIEEREADIKDRENKVQLYGDIETKYCELIRKQSALEERLKKDTARATDLDKETKEKTAHLSELVQLAEHVSALPRSQFRKP